MNIIQKWKKYLPYYLKSNVDNKISEISVPIGTIFYHISNVPPTGAFLLNGQIIYNCSTLYPEFYSYITNNNEIRKITSSAYESELSAIGMCGGFVVDIENGSIRLPNISNGFIEGSNGSNIGNTIDAGLPNITGDSQIYFQTLNAATNPINLQYGAFRITDSRKVGSASGEEIYSARLGFNAYYHNQIYGSSNTVQPKSVCYSICIQVFHTSSVISTQQSSQISSEIQNKAGINADNFTNIGKDKIINTVFELDWNNATNILTNVIYSATKSGIVTIRAGRNNLSSFYISICSFDANKDDSILNNLTNENYINGTTTYSSTGYIISSWLVIKSDKYIVQATNGAEIIWCKFIPFKNSLANS